MQPKTNKRSRWRRVLLCALGLCLLVFLTFPFWLPLFLKGVLGGVGIQVASVERRGVFGLGLRELEYGFPGGHIQVEEVGLSDWAALVALGWESADRLEVSPVRVRGWTLMLDPARGVVADEEEKVGSGVGVVLDQVGSLGRVLRRWVPPVELENGLVEAPGLGIRVGRAGYAGGEVKADVDAMDLGFAGRLELRLDDAGAYQVGVKLADPWLADLEVNVTGVMEGWDVIAGGRIEGQEFGLSARYPREGGEIWPEKFELSVRDGGGSGLVERVPGLERVGGILRGVGDEAELELEWLLDGRHEEQVIGEVRVEGGGRVGLAGGELGRLEVGIAAGGVSLVSPIRVEWERLVEQLRSDWLVRFDLSRQGWVEAVGMLNGEVKLEGLVEGGVEGTLLVRGVGAPGGV